MKEKGQATGYEERAGRDGASDPVLAPRPSFLASASGSSLAGPSGSFLYRGTLAVAGGLGLFVLIAGLLPVYPVTPWAKVWYLFAFDSLVRKTAVLSAIGLWVTAVVFFRPGRYNERRVPLES